MDEKNQLGLGLDCTPVVDHKCRPVTVGPVTVKYMRQMDKAWCRDHCCFTTIGTILYKRAQKRLSPSGFAVATDHDCQTAGCVVRRALHQSELTNI